VVPLGHLVRAADAASAGADLVGVQTPQAFRAADLLAAYTAADADGFEGTDTASCLERYGRVRVVAVPGSPLNLKITFPEDVDLAEALLDGSRLTEPTADPRPWPPRASGPRPRS
jgi:2-C-methyl-D-erythritol 4-phosphate cytidylyltransferase